jgi:subtilisin family serine protease
LRCVVIFITHNHNGPIVYPAKSNDDIIAVGAISPCGERKNPNSRDGDTNWGSNYGPKLDIMAPCVLIPTTDLQGLYGYNPNGDYMQNASGTSIAAQPVAAVTALILSHNLTQNKWQILLKVLHKKLVIILMLLHPEGLWYVARGNGYGLVDAEAAALLAQSMCTEPHMGY